MDTNYWPNITDEEFYELFKNAWKELGGEDRTPTGMIRPGLYHLGDGVYTGKGGWEIYLKAMQDRVYGTE